MPTELEIQCAALVLANAEAWFPAPWWYPVLAHLAAAIGAAAVVSFALGVLAALAWRRRPGRRGC